MTKKYCCCVFPVSLWAVFSPLAAQAAPPPNDHFTNAIPLRGLIVTTTGDNADATREPGEPFHWASTGGRSVWWTWTAPASGVAVINTFGSTFDTILAVYTGSVVSNLTLLANNDDFSSTQSRVEFTASAGTVYRIAVDGYGTSPPATGSITLNIIGPASAPGTVTLISTGAVWRYLDDGSDQGTAWRAPSYNDAGWSNGLAQLGYGDGDEATLIRSNRQDGTRIITTYFRRAFVVAEPGQFTSLTVRLLRDDGAAVYLNGTEIVRDGLPPNAGYNDLATITVGGVDENTYFAFTNINPALLVPGTNVVAAEVHQVNLTSSDVSFDLELVGFTTGSSLPPLVSLTSPPANALFASPATLALAAEAWDDDGAITNVDFYANAQWLGRDTTHPYELSWSGVAAGAYALTAVATDNGGLRATSAVVNVTVTNNPPPVVALTSPTEGQSFVVPGNIPLAAEATDEHGVSRVEFFRGAIKLGEVLVAPFTFTWTNALAGSHALRAVATDGLGARGTSAVVNITVTGNYPPTVALTSPPDQTTFSAPANVPLAASASDYDGTIVRVEFFAGAAKLGEATASPYTLTWSNAPLGSHALTAVATDNAGAKATSAVVNITIIPNTPPSVSLVSPTNGARFSTADAINLEATASDPNGGVALVEFFSGATKLGETAAAPFRRTWTNPPAGLHLLTAVATDNGGLRATSAPVQVTVTDVALLSGGLEFDGVDDYVTFGVATNLGLARFTLETWFYWKGYGVAGSSGSGGVMAIPLICKGRGEADGSNLDCNYFFGILPGSRTLAADFEDFRPTGNNNPVSGRTPIPSNEWHHAAVTYDGTNWALYLDGVLETNLLVSQTPRFDSIQHASLATALDSTGAYQGAFAGLLDEVRIWNYARSASQIASNRHLQIASAPGLVGRWALDEKSGLVANDSSGGGTRGTLVNGPVWTLGYPFAVPPGVVLLQPSEGAVIFTPTNVTLEATAVDLDGAVVAVAFYAGETLLGTAVAEPFIYTWVNPLPGDYTLRAVATDNMGLSSTSAPVNVRVENLVVQLASPTNGARFIAPDAVRLAANVSAAGGPISLVEFYVGGAKAGEASSPPYTVNWASVVGDYALTAVATASGGLRHTSAPVNITVTANQPPLVALIAPGDGAVYYVPAVVSLSASASDPEGSVAQVQFFAGSTLLFTDAAPPYQYPWTNAPLGAHALWAVATDDRGLAATSTVVNITVTTNTPPLVQITSPTHGAAFIAPATVTLQASASDADGIQSVQYFAGTTSLGQAATAPYTVVWNGVLAGDYQLVAVATDGFGLAATSAVVAIRVTNNTPPVVELIAPTNNASFRGPTNIVLEATASDADGIARVDFFQGNILLGFATASPYRMTWFSVPGGNYLLTAVATDGAGVRATSAPVNIVVSGSLAGTNVLISFGARWKYLDNGSDQGTAWQAPGFDDSLWPEGPAQLGYGNGDEATVVSYGPDPNNKYPTTYFRRAFVVNNAGFNFLNLRLLYDDGGVVYLNGTEIYRTPTMPSGAINYLTYTTSTSENNAIATVNGLPNLLVPGTNVVAVEIHQANPISSDISFDLELAGVVTNTPPVVFLTEPPNNATLTAPTNVTLTASAADTDGTVTLVEFFVGGTKIGQATTPPYTATWTATLGGAFQLWAVATDNLGLRATSAVANVTVIGNLPPAVSLISPPANRAYVIPTNILLEASAGDPDGTIANVRFYADSTLLFTDTDAPFTFDWSVSTLGTFFLTAVATDNSGASATSAPVRVTFVSQPTGGSLVNTGAIWKYFDTVTNEMPGWNTLGYDDSAWPSGPAQLGYGDGDEATVVGYGPNPSNRYVTTYFRHTFAVPDPGIYRSLFVRLLRDDGGIVYLNGVEVFRSNMPEGPVTINTLAAGNAQDDGTIFFSSDPISPGLLLPGNNVVAVEIHQATLSSSDISFDLELIGNTTNARPLVAITSPASETIFTTPADITINVSANDSDGTVTNVTFFAGETLLGQDAFAPFSYIWSGAPLGTHSLWAVATDNYGDTGTSSVVRVYVVASTAPTVNAWLPPAGLVSNLTAVTVEFSEPVDGVNAADLLINGVPASTVQVVNAATYLFTFPQPADGPVSVAWAVGHGIVDRETPPKPFLGTGPGETALYTLTDTVPPQVVALSPTPGATIRALAEVQVTFSEAVNGVVASNLLLNGVPARKVTGSLAGPYVFEFPPPVSNGLLQLTWATNQNIRDFASTPNRFAGGAWSYTLDPTAPEGSVVINEIMYHPASEDVREEFIELLNRSAVPIHLTGWQITGGVDFTFPAAVIPAGGYLVVAADVAVFRAKYPAVTNVVGGWIGRLSNSDDEIRLRNALGQVVHRVHYATEGDWAIRQRGPNDLGTRGWQWFAAHDGNVINTATGQNEGNRSLELLNPALPTDNGQNWAASLPANGTPGQRNSTATNDVPPLIYDVTHFPPVPKSSEPVTISARVVDELPGVLVQLYYRDASTVSPPAFTSVMMFDDGLHGDGLAGDGVFAVQLPAQPNRTIVEYYVAATDDGGATRTWPAPARLETGVFAQRANAAYQVDNEDYTGGRPIYRLVLTAAELAEFDAMNRNSNAEMNATLITVDGTGTRVRHNCGMRIRGAGTRGANPPNVRVNIPTDRRWNGLSELNLNSQYPHAQLAGSVFSLKSGMPCAGGCAIQMRFNGQNRANAGLPQYGHYICLEPINGEWAARHFPDDPNGNVYRGSRYPWTANLSYRGTNPTTYLNEGYSKTSNQSENDWSDLIALTLALNDTNSPNYTHGVQQNANVRLFMRYFAVCTLLDYMETSMCRGVGDDYAMYRGLKDPRFLLIPHDFDTILGQGDSPHLQNPLNPLWPMLNPPTSDPTMRANYLFTFMRHPEFAPLYYEELLRLLETTYHPAQMSPMLDDLLGSWAPDAVPLMKTFVTNRYNYARSQIPTTLTITHNLSTQNGYLYAPTPNVTLRGRSHAARTRSVRVAGALADWSAFDAAWTNTVSLQPGLNRVLVQAFDTNRLEFDRASLEIWYDRGGVQNVSGTIASDTLWTAAGGPYQVSAHLTVAPGVTLTLQPGTTVYLGAGVNFIVANGGRLVAEGTETAPIRFTRAPGASGTWGGITIHGGPASPESRLVHVHIEFNNSTAIQVTDGTVFLSNLTFGNTARQYLSLDRASFVVQDCTFPATTASFEPVHGSGGIKAGGRGIFLRNFFGPITGYNDCIDFTGGQRPGPILQVINNVFMGTGDDHLDLDNTDAWVEGNLFLHAHKNGSPDTASAVSGGDDVGTPSDITILGNLIYDCDHAANAKQGNFYSMLHNTIVRQTHVGGLDTEGAVVVLADNGMAEGRGIYLEGNIIWDAQALTRDRTNALVTFTNNLMNLPWAGPGGGNVAGDPLFRYEPALAETTNFTSWAAAQVMWDWFGLRPGSPAAGAGPNGRDLGAVEALRTSDFGLRTFLRGVSIAGEPVSPTPQTSARLTVGLNRTGNGILPSGWPDGAGFTHYRWRLDGGVWSGETPLSVPLVLTGLSVGPHYVEAVGKNDAGLWQDDPVLGPDARVTVSRTWTVNPNASALRLNEVLARNDSAVPVGSRFPDLVELWNAGPDPLDLAGYSLTDDKDQPRKFAFPPGATLGAGKYLVLYADSENTPVGYHLGFALKQGGDDLYLFAPDGRLLDSVTWGPQLPDLSIGRLADGTWALVQPSFGGPNRAVPLGDPRSLKLNEWLAVGVGQDDFIELFNPDPRPVNMAGLFLTDAPQSLQRLHAIPSLSFIAGGGYFAFVADGNTGAGPEHLSFRLAAENGLIGLFAPDLQPIDCIAYGPQSANVSQGRSPNGSANVVFFPGPTPGLPNYTPPPPLGLQLVINEVLAKNIEGLTNVDGSTPEWIELFNPTAQTISLAGMSLTDTSAAPRKFVFPAGVNLAPGGRLVVLCAGGLPASTNTDGLYLHSGFGLKANGGVVHLYDTLARGGALLDEISYGVQAKDFSIGRVPDGSTNWVLCLPSAGAANVAVAALGDPGQLRVNEWMADPVSGSDWFELYNPQPQPVALGGLWLSDDLSTVASRKRSQIRPLSFIGTGLYGYERFLADNNPNAGPDHVAFALARNGESLGVSWPDGTLIDGLSFGPQLTGVSEGRLPDGAANIVKFPTTPTPGDANYLPLTNVVINEVLTATPAGAPLEDAIELLNTSSTAVDLSGWWLSDARRELKKYRIPQGVVLPPGGFVVFYESNSFNALPDEPTSFQLSGTKGDEVYLSSANPDGVLTGYRASAEFGPAEPGVSFGRYTNSVGQVDFVALSRRTFGADNAETVEEFRTGTGAPNAYPRVGPVVFHEIMYRPPALAGADNVRDEYIELFNPSATEAVPLFDPANPQNTWRLRGGVDLDFPPGLTLPPGGYLLVVSFDPVENTNALAGFRAAYRLAGDVILVGPYQGKLDNGGESIELRRPGAPVPPGQPEAGTVPYIVVERVVYDDVWPWDSYADGTGWSLHRLDPFDYGNDPNNWLAGPPTPGPQGSVLDGDQDGMLDAWEREHGLNPNDPSDAAQDADGDGLTNLQEFLAGTHPRDPASVLKVEVSLGSPVTLQFLGQPNRTYVLEYRDAVDTGAWTVLQTFTTGAAAEWVQFNDAQVRSPRFYRLRLQ